MAAPNASMLELSQFISDHTAKLNDYLAANKLPQPSFAADAPSPDYLPTSARAISKVRNDLADAAQQLAFLARGPKANVLDHTIGRVKIPIDCVFQGTSNNSSQMHDSWTVQVINRYNLAKHVPLNGTVTFTEISKLSGLEFDKCRRILRYAMNCHLFYEPTPEHVAHTAMSALLAKDESARDIVSHCMEDVFPGTTSEANAIAKWPNTNDPAKCGLSLGFNLADGKSIFDWFGDNPARAEIFGGAMAFLGSEGTDISAMAEVGYGYDWKHLGKASLVDVGGSRGHVSIALAQVAPEMTFIVQDLPEVISQVSGAPPGLEKRLKYEVYNFRTPQPVKDADVYFFRRIFHDWPDHICTDVILKNLVPSMKLGSRVILNECILPRPEDECGAWERKLQNALDMQMMVAISSRERSLADWRELFANGSEGKLVFESGKNSMLSWVRKD